MKYRLTQDHHVLEDAKAGTIVYDSKRDDAEGSDPVARLVALTERHFDPYAAEEGRPVKEPCIAVTLNSDGSEPWFVVKKSQVEAFGTASS